MAKLPLNINKTWGYKSLISSFAETKNTASILKVPPDCQVVMQFATLILIKNIPQDRPFFVTEGKHAYNEKANDILERNCKRACTPIISIHGLRLTYYAGPQANLTKSMRVSKQKHDPQSLFTIDKAMMAAVKDGNFKGTT